jgi:hypothetical protein
MKQRIAFALLMGAITTGVISFALIYLNLGFGDSFLNTWSSSWGVAYLIAIPVILLIAPRLQAVIAKGFLALQGAGGGGALQQKIAFALIMGAITTGVISFALITRNFGFGEQFVNVWARSWGFAYLVVIPALLIIAPRVQRLVDRMFMRAAA